MPRAYHSGDHEEIGAMLAAIRARVAPDTVVHAAGVSLGGSALLNWLGRAGRDAARVLTSRPPCPRRSTSPPPASPSTAASTGSTRGISCAR